MGFVNYFLFVSQVFSVRSTDVKLVFFCDHSLLLANCHLQDDQPAGKGTWKLNVKLLNDMKPTDRAPSQSFLSSITEVLDGSTRERLDQLLSLDELTKALKFLEKNKTPRSDGLLAELYSALWVLIGQDLLEAGRLLRALCRLGYDRLLQNRGVSACLISLRLEKAFDRILHEYMRDVLSELGF
eukprot:g39869.t1